MNFTYGNVKFKRQEEGTGLMMTVEITNNSGRNFNSVVFRIVVFIKTMPIASLALTVNGFAMGQTKVFERRIEELEYKITPEITRYEVYPESAY